MDIAKQGEEVRIDLNYARFVAALEQMPSGTKASMKVTRIAHGDALHHAGDSQSARARALLFGDRSLINRLNAHRISGRLTNDVNVQ